jgi:hypothetical protein
MGRVEVVMSAAPNVSLAALVSGVHIDRVGQGVVEASGEVRRRRHAHKPKQQELEVHHGRVPLQLGVPPCAGR